MTTSVTSFHSSSNCTGWEHRRGFSSSLLFLCASVCTGQHRRISPTSSSTWLISRAGDAFDLLPHCRWMSVVHSCPPSVIRPSLLLSHTWNSLPQHVTSALSMSVVRGRLKAFLFRRSRCTSLCSNICSACAVTVVVFGHFNHSFYLLTYCGVYWPQVELCTEVVQVEQWWRRWLMTMSSTAIVNYCR